KFGYPFSAITTDYQQESKIFQCRIQYDYIFFNIFLVSIIAIPIYFLLKIIYIFLKNIFVNSRIFEK
ncbi:MAG: hypothetical protein KUL74_04925, partial [Cloacibacterium sp.]|nr:hypothetical protein [Cloacibacterium sp.]